MATPKSRRSVNPSKKLSDPIHGDANIRAKERFFNILGQTNKIIVDKPNEFPKLDPIKNFICTYKGCYFIYANSTATAKHYLSNHTECGIMTNGAICTYKFNSDRDVRRHTLMVHKNMKPSTQTLNNENESDGEVEHGLEESERSLNKKSKRTTRRNPVHLNRYKCFDCFMKLLMNPEDYIKPLPFLKEHQSILGNNFKYDTKMNHGMNPCCKKRRANKKNTIEKIKCTLEDVISSQSSYFTTDVVTNRFGGNDNMVVESDTIHTSSVVHNGNRKGMLDNNLDPMLKKRFKRDNIHESDKNAVSSRDDNHCPLVSVSKLVLEGNTMSQMRVTDFEYTTLNDERLTSDDVCESELTNNVHDIGFDTQEAIQGISVFSENDVIEAISGTLSKPMSSITSLESDIAALRERMCETRQKKVEMNRLTTELEELEVALGGIQHKYGEHKKRYQLLELDLQTRIEKEEYLEAKLSERSVILENSTSDSEIIKQLNKKLTETEVKNRQIVQIERNIQEREIELSRRDEKIQVNAIQVAKREAEIKNQYQEIAEKFKRHQHMEMEYLKKNNELDDKIKKFAVTETNLTKESKELEESLKLFQERESDFFKKNQELDDKYKRLESQEIEFANKNKILEEKFTRIALKESELVKKNQEITIKNTKNAYVVEENVTMKLALLEKDLKIEQLNNELHEHKNEINKLTKQLATMESELFNMKRNFEDNVIDLAELNAKFVEKQQEICEKDLALLEMERKLIESEIKVEKLKECKFELQKHIEDNDKILNDVNKDLEITKCKLEQECKQNGQITEVNASLRLTINELTAKIQEQVCGTSSKDFSLHEKLENCKNRKAKQDFDLKADQSKFECMQLKLDSIKYTLDLVISKYEDLTISTKKNLNDFMRQLMDENTELKNQNIALKTNLNDILICVELSFGKNPISHRIDHIKLLDDNLTIRSQFHQIQPFQYIALKMMENACPATALIADLKKVLLENEDTFNIRRKKFMNDLFKFNKWVLENGKPYQSSGEHILNLGQVRIDLQKIIGFQRDALVEHNDYRGAVVYIDGANIGRMGRNILDSVRGNPMKVGKFIGMADNGKFKIERKSTEMYKPKPIQFYLITKWIKSMINKGLFRKFIVVLRNNDLYNPRNPNVKIALLDEHYRDLVQLAIDSDKVEIVELDGYDDIYLVSHACSHNAVIFSSDEYKDLRSFVNEMSCTGIQEHFMQPGEKGNVVKYAFGEEVDKWLKGGSGKIFYQLKPQYDSITDSVTVRADSYGYNGYTNAALVANCIPPLKKKPSLF